MKGKNGFLATAPLRDEQEFGSQDSDQAEALRRGCKWRLISLFGNYQIRCPALHQSQNDDDAGAAPNGESQVLDQRNIHYFRGESIRGCRVL